MREVVSVNIGQAGVQIGNTMWEFLSKESGLDRSGVCLDDSKVNVSAFNEHVGRYSPRTCFIDSDPTAMDETLNRSAIKPSYINEFWIKGDEDCQGNFARGKYFASKLLLPNFIKSFRRLLEACDSISILEAVHSTSGGTGSGLGVTMLTILDDILPKTQKHLHSVVPSENESPTTAAYNTILCWAQTEDFHSLRFMYDNHSMYDILHPILGPIGVDTTFNDINTLPGLVVCNLHCPQTTGTMVIYSSHFTFCIISNGLKHRYNF
jgi:tubulin alpha